MSWNPQRQGIAARQPQPRGILRKSQKKSTHHQHQRPSYTESLTEKDEDEMLVFGYACKIFPPDNHSRDIAKGRHLILWNGDENLQLLIDRYDARASLHDLSDFGGDSWNTQYEMSEEEARIEQLCDQERYMAMYTDIAEEKMRHEEELKRLHASIAGDDISFKEVGFKYHDDSSLPSQSTSNACSAQSEQDQPQVDSIDEDQEEKPFMAHDSLAIPPEMEIPPTEKMHAIIEKTAGFVSKQGAQMEIILKAKQANSSQFLFLDFDHYLNPYYKHILQRIKDGKHVVGMTSEQEKEEEEESDSDDEGGYLHPSLFASAHKVNKEDEEKKKENLKAIQKVDPNHPLAKLIEKGKKANALKQYNIMRSAVQNFNPGTENALEPPPLPKFIMDGERSSTGSLTSAQEQDPLPANITPQEAAMVIVPPPPDIQPMVDSVAKQIAEDGDAVEQTMREKKDSLLAFLEPSHELHPYYTFRKTFIREQLKAQKRMFQQAQEVKDAEEKQKQSAPISFSIKGKENAPKTTLISTRLQALGDDSENSDDDGEQDVEEGEGAIGENKENEKGTEKTSKQKDESKPSSKRKFVEITVIEAVKPSVKDTSSAIAVTTMSEEDRKRLLEQTRRKFTDAPPLTLPNPASMSTFTVVTPDGNTMSIAEFRERQAERRKKAAELALQKAKEEAAALKHEPPQPKNPATQDIFDIFEDEDSKTDKKLNPRIQEISASLESESLSKDSSSERKQSPSVLSTAPAMTLKDLVVAASRSSTPSSIKEGRRHRSRSRSPERSRSRSRSRQSSPRHSYNVHRRRSRSGSRDDDRDFVPSSYKKILGSASYRPSSSRHSRYEDNESVPSAYKIENPPAYQSNGSYSRSRQRKQSPRHRSHKRRRHDSRNEEDEKKRKSYGSSPHKSKKKSSASKKRHKKKKSKSKKKKDKNRSSSEDGELSSDSDQMESDTKRLQSSKGQSNGTDTRTMEPVEGGREDGELVSRA